MNIRLPAILAGLYIILAFVLIKGFSMIPLVFFAAALLIEFFTPLKKELKNIAYIIAAFSVFPSVLAIFFVFLPFCVFSFLLPRKNFLSSYVFAFALFFIPVNIIYLLTTYLPIKVNYLLVLFICYILPLCAFFLIGKRSFHGFEADTKDVVFILIALAATTAVGYVLFDDNQLFMANGVRIFSRVEVAYEGIVESGQVPIYNPGIATGEMTYLFNTPSFKTGVALVQYLIGPSNPVSFFNDISFFILFLSMVGLAVLYRSLHEGKESIFLTLGLAAVSIIVGLNFTSLQMLESFKANYAYPIGYLFLSIILNNPRTFRHFAVLLYLAAMLITVHFPYGSGVLAIGLFVFILRKWHILKDRSELLQFFPLPMSRKTLIVATMLLILLMPLFYVSAGIIYKDSLSQKTTSLDFSFSEIKQEFLSSISVLFRQNIPEYFTLKYPDVNRIDDHKFGFFITIAGALSLLFCLLYARSPLTRGLWILALGFLLNIMIAGAFYSHITLIVGGFFRTTMPFLLLLAGASIFVALCIMDNKLFRGIAIAIIFLAFFHSLPTAKQNLSNIHREAFASGLVYSQELEFIKNLPNDGRILTYGLFNNAVDFGGNYLTKKYFSRDEKDMMNVQRRLFEKVHGQHSFGDPDIVLTKKGQELANYLSLGGYKYLFLNAAHPIGQHIMLELSPSFASKIFQNLPLEYANRTKEDFATPIYQNGPLLFLVVNNTHYAEKVDIVSKLPADVYMTEKGYWYTSTGPYYKNLQNPRFKYSQDPQQPTPLRFQRSSPTEVHIFGNFEENDAIVFKEQYFPRWRAYMGNTEIPVFPTNFEMILIQASKGNEIVLRYEVLFKEKIFGITSLIATLLVSFMLLFLLRGAAKPENELDAVQ